MTGATEIVPDRNVNDPASGFWGFTSRLPGGHWQTHYNLARVFGPASSRAALQFLFYHECAHARFNSTSEHVADCGALRAMDDDIGVSAEDLDAITRAYASVGRSFPSGGACS